MKLFVQGVAQKLFPTEALINDSVLQQIQNMPDRKTEYRKPEEQAKLDCGAVFGLANKCVII